MSFGQVIEKLENLPMIIKMPAAFFIFLGLFYCTYQQGRRDEADSWYRAIDAEEEEF